MVISNDITWKLYWHFILFQTVCISQLYCVLWKLWPIIPFLKELKVFLEKKILREEIGGWRLNMLGIFEFTEGCPESAGVKQDLTLDVCKVRAVQPKNVLPYKAKKTLTPPVLTSCILSLSHFILKQFYEERGDFLWVYRWGTWGSEGLRNMKIT